MPNIAHTPPILTPNPRRDRLASWRIGGLILLLLVFCQGAWAADAANTCGVDTDRNGSVDNWCPTPDADNDGYLVSGYTGGLSGIDCDDNDFQIYPTVYTAKGCDAGYYHYCDTDGVYKNAPGGSSAVANGGAGCVNTTLAEGVHNYYIDCGSGDDGNAGSKAAPFKTFGMITGGYGATPADKVTLVAGDYVYLVGSADCTDVYQADAVDRFAYLPGIDGTALAPIVFKRYPGSTAIIKIPTTVYSGGFLLDSATYVKFYGLEFSQPTGTSLPIIRTTGAHITVSNCSFHEIAGNGDNNFAPIYAANTTYVTADHNLFVDIKAATGSADGINAVAWIDNTGGGYGVGHSATYNQMLYTGGWSAADRGNCFGEKHGVTAAEAGAGGHVIKGNFCYDAQRFLRWNGSGLRATNNVFATSVTTTTGAYTPYFIKWWDDGEAPGLQDNQVQYNTAINSKLGLTVGVDYGSAEILTVDHNVIVDPSTSYPGDSGMLVVDIYGSADDRTAFEGYGDLAITNNCYLASAFQVPYFNSGGGTTYDWAGWVAKGYDSGSYNEDPTLDADGIATAANCSDKGWRTASDYPAVPTVGLSGFSAASNIFSFTGGN